MRLSRYPVPGDVSSHKSLSISFIKKNLTTRPWNWRVVSENQNFSWFWVTELPHEAWDWRALSKNPYFIWKWVDEFPEKDWDWDFLSTRVEHVITVAIYREKPWNWLVLTMSENIPVEDILRYPDFPWVVNSLFFTRVTDFEIPFIRHYKNTYDDIAWKDHTSRASWEVIRDNMDLPWVFTDIKPKTCTIKDIPILVDNRDVWDWKILSHSVPIGVIHETRTLGLPWDHEEISKNPTVDIFSVRQCDWVRWNMAHVSLDAEIHLWNAAQTIKRYWKRCATHPGYMICRKLVMNEIQSILRYERDVRESSQRKEVHDTGPE